MNWFDTILAVGGIGAVTWMCGPMVAVRLFVGSLAVTLLLAVIIEVAVPCDGFGEAFRMFLKVQCQ